MTRISAARPAPPPPPPVDDSATAHDSEGTSVRRTVQSLYGEDGHS